MKLPLPFLLATLLSPTDPAWARSGPDTTSAPVVGNAQGSVTSAVAQVVVGYPLAVTNVGSGTIEVDPALAVYEPGQTVQLRAIPETGWAFQGWAGDASGLANPIRLVMDAPKSVQARFSAPPGTKLWEFQGGGVYHAFASLGASPPALGIDGTVYVIAWDAVGMARVCALIGDTGVARWTRSLATWQRAGPAVGADGAVYVGGDRAVALEAATGATRWEATLAGATVSAPALGLDGTVYVAASESTDSPRGWVYALDGARGAKAWEYALGTLGGPYSAVFAPAVGADGTVYVGYSRFIMGRGFYTGTVLALDGTSGALRWKFDNGGGRVGPPVLGPPATLYVAGDRVQALDGTSGVPLWRSDIAGENGSSPIFGNAGTVCVSSLGESFTVTIRALDGTTGLPRWETSGLQGGRVVSPPALAADGTMVVGTFNYFEALGLGWGAYESGLIHALDGTNGAVRWTCRTGTTGVDAGPALGANGVIYVTTLTQQGYGGGAWAMKVLAIQGTAELARSPWPKARGDAQNTGRAQPALSVPAVLQFTLVPPQLILSWDQPGMRLQTTLGLGTTAEWQDWPGPATNPVTIPIEPSSGQRFFQLRSTAGDPGP